MSENERVVREFIAAWSRLDPSELAGYFTEDGCYDNVPAQPVRGREQIEAFIRGFTAAWTKTEWEIRTLVVRDDVVVAERIDRIETDAGPLELPCTGIFEMRDGRIHEWRDYFDLATYTRAIQG